MAKELFNKPMSELREAFVRTKFAQDDVFGRPDIEEWIAGQRKAGRPDHDMKSGMSPWLSLFATRFPHERETARERLIERATSFSGISEPVEGENPFRGENQRHARLYVALIAGAHPWSGKKTFTRLYYGYKLGAVAVTEDSDKPTLFSMIRSDHGEVVLEPFDHNPGRAMQFIFDVLYAEWLYGREYWGAARTYLHDLLAMDVVGERMKAEHDFDTAVAVNADGKKIVHADWVVVTGLSTPTRGFAHCNEHGCEQRCLVFHGEAFRERKIQRTEHFQRCVVDANAMVNALVGGTAFSLDPCSDIPWVLSGSQGVLYVHGSGPHPQKLATIYGLCDGSLANRIPETRVFVTPRDLCPSPLPDGGVEVAV